MKLPYAAKARVERKKIVEYLLSFSHPDGSSKAEFFSRFGFFAWMDGKFLPVPLGNTEERMT